MDRCCGRSKSLEVASVEMRSNTCQSYSMALSMAFQPQSPFQANTPAELRDLEERIRQSLLDSASHHDGDPTRDDWQAAAEKVTSGVLTVRSKAFSNLDSAMHFVGDTTGITDPGGLGTTLAATLVKTPVMMSFNRIQSSKYFPSSHIITVFGVQLTPVSLDEDDHPQLLLVNFAVKYANNIKNVCDQGDLSDQDNKFHPNPYLISYVSAK